MQRNAADGLFTKPSKHQQGKIYMKEEKKKKKKYEKPKIIYRREIETLAVTCDSALQPWGNCRITSPCLYLYT